MIQTMRLNDHHDAVKVIKKMLEDHEMNNCNIHADSKTTVPASMSITVKEKDDVYITIGRMNYVDVQITTQQYALMLVEQASEIITRLSNIVNTRH